jgi:hypothetical protein
MVQGKIADGDVILTYGWWVSNTSVFQAFVCHES